MRECPWVMTGSEPGSSEIASVVGWLLIEDTSEASSLSSSTVVEMVLMVGARDGARVSDDAVKGRVWYESDDPHPYRESGPRW